MYSPKLREPARVVRRSGFLLRGRRVPSAKKVSRTGPYRSDLMQPMDAGNRGRLQTLVLGLFFSTNAATSTCPGGIGLDRGARLRPRAQAATAPEGPGGRRRADRPASVPAWASTAATASGGARRR